MTTTSTPPDALPASKEAEAVAFGEGKLVIDTGTFHGRPAVFIAPAKYPGEVGASADREGNDLHTLQPGEIVLTFPTDEQARAVEAALFAHPPTDAGVSEAVTDAMVERAWAVIVGEDIAATCFNANIVRGDLRAALSTAIPAGDGVPPGMARNALDCVVHALMVLPVPIDGQGKRAWASLLEAQTILEGLSTASTAGKG